MDSKSTSELSPLPEDIVEGWYAEESEEEDQTVRIQSLMKQIQDLFLIHSKNKGKRREQTSYTPGASPSEPSLPRHVRPEDSPISPTPGPGATSTPKTEQTSQIIPKKLFLSTPNHPIPLQNEIPKRVEAAAEIEGASGEYIARKVIFMSASEEAKEKIEAIQDYEEKSWTKLKEELTTECGRVDPDRRYRPESLEKLFNNTKETRRNEQLS
ncbi:hypothetical protein O181_108604 [Austropuccinia psidii MF-1]|uniref:Uncharacterized protein n=1 Tax=Austropuccinia psidii MF-1 TaxID=1389203 RepID=A0A9Q3JV25_9BASI|nr:hypothetical protein [Austropuccinia psidii MF-1]